MGALSTNSLYDFPARGPSKLINSVCSLRSKNLTKELSYRFPQLVSAHNMTSYPFPSNERGTLAPPNDRNTLGSAGHAETIERFNLYFRRA